MSALYVVVCPVLGLIVLIGRGDRAKELEILDVVPLEAVRERALRRRD